MISTTGNTTFSSNSALKYGGENGPARFRFLRTIAVKAEADNSLPKYRHTLENMTGPSAPMGDGLYLGNFQGFSQVMTRSAGRIKRVSKSRGSGRVGSGQEVFRISRVGSGHDPRDTGHVAGQDIMTRELFWGWPADLARGSAFFQLLQLRVIDIVQTPRGSSPRSRKYNSNISASCLPRADAPIICQYSVQNNHQPVPLATRTKAYRSVTQISTEAVRTVVILRSYQYKM